jgi:hypothetical protein
MTIDGSRARSVCLRRSKPMELATPYLVAGSKRCAVVAVAADTACLVLGGQPHPLINLEIDAEGIFSDVIIPTSVLPDGVLPEDELIITFRLRICRLCGSRSSSWADVDVCSACDSVRAVVLTEIAEGENQCSE